MDISEQDGLIRFDLLADAFLHHMVRNIVGALVYVGKGALRPRRWRACWPRATAPRAAHLHAGWSVPDRRGLSGNIRFAVAGGRRATGFVEMRVGGTTRIKICGITRPEDGAEAARLGADAIGLVFYAKSPRHVDVEQARAVIAALPPFVSVVALFVNPEPEYVREVLAACAIDILQFHGEEDAAAALSSVLI